jgi:hypothetical protein
MNPTLMMIKHCKKNMSEIWRSMMSLSMTIGTMSLQNTTTKRWSRTTIIRNMKTNTKCPQSTMNKNTTCMTTLMITKTRTTMIKTIMTNNLIHYSPSKIRMLIVLSFTQSFALAY